MLDALNVCPNVELEPGTLNRARLLRCEQFLDLRSKPLIIRFDGAFECGYRLSRFIEQVLVEIPARWFAGLRGEVAKEWIGFRADDRCLGEYRKRDAVVHLAELRDLLVRSGLLGAEIVRRKSEHDESFVAIAAI